MGASICSCCVVPADGKFVAVPLPDSWPAVLRLSDGNLLRLLKVVLLQLDEETRNSTRNQHPVEQVVALLREGASLESRVDAADAFREPYTIIATEPIFEPQEKEDVAEAPSSVADGSAAAGSASSGTDDPLYGKAWRVYDPLEELRSLVELMQQLHISTLEREKRGRAGEARVASDALRVRAAALTLRNVALLRTSRVVLAQAPSIAFLEEGLMLPLPSSRHVKMFQLFNDWDSSSQGYLTKREWQRIGETVNHAAATAHGFTSILQMAPTRKRNRMQIDEFVWFTHTVCVSMDEDLAYHYFRELADAKTTSGQRRLRLDGVESRFAAWTGPGAADADQALLKALVQERERREALIAQGEITSLAISLADFFRICQNQPLVLRGMQFARMLLQANTFGSKFWGTRRDALRQRLMELHGARAMQATAPRDVSAPPAALYVCQMKLLFEAEKSHVRVSSGILGNDDVWDELQAHHDELSRKPPEADFGDQEEQLPELSTVTQTRSAAAGATEGPSRFLGFISKIAEAPSAVGFDSAAAEGLDVDEEELDGAEDEMEEGELLEGVSLTGEGLITRLPPWSPEHPPPVPGAVPRRRADRVRVRPAVRALDPYSRRRGLAQKQPKPLPLRFRKEQDRR